MRSTEPDPRIIVALDFPSAGPALELVERLDPGLCRLKVGKEIFTRAGPELVERLSDKGFDVFLDLKFHDIPNTVAAACEAAADLGVWMLNVHASGGRKMMQTARERLDRSQHRPLLVAVTVLTSLGEGDLGEIGFAGTPADNVRRLAGLAEDSGMDGVVCSPREARMLRADCREGFLLVTPGVRPRDAAKGDQKRVMTPGEAIQAGSNFLVVGRPVTAAPDPLQALERIRAELVLDTVDS